MRTVCWFQAVSVVLWLSGLTIAIAADDPTISAVQSLQNRVESGTWKDLREAIDKKHQDHLKSSPEGHDWFTNAANGYGGVPVILLRSLPDLAPNIWGGPEERFSRFGFISSSDEVGKPLPLGLSWDSLLTEPAAAPLRRVTFTCGACHIGQVRVPGAERPSFKILVGAPNTQIDVRRWRRAFEQTVEELLGNQADITKTAERWRQIIASKPENYFYTNHGVLPSDVEQRERALLATTTPTDVAVSVLTNFAHGVSLGRLAVSKQKATSYGKSNAPPLDGGSPGQSDGSGDLIPRLLLLDFVRDKGVQIAMRDFQVTPFGALPDKKATVTDIISTFKQGARNTAQIDGSVKSPFYRNVAASLAVAGDPALVNARNAEIAVSFLRDLPAPAYPFDVDMQRAIRGRSLFSYNCAPCHRDQNDNLYKPANPRIREQIGTDPNRSEVLNAETLRLFLKHFVASVPADFMARDAQGNLYRPHDLPAHDIVFDRTEFANQGYVTDALHGVWTRAPYLHNGSVPTLYHVLVPDQRPLKFVRGSVTYDTKHVGWCSDIAEIDEYRQADPSAAVFDTTWDSASNKGHDQNLIVDSNGKIIRIGWHGAELPGERKVRLNWSGPQNSEDLADLLAYLTTL